MFIKLVPNDMEIAGLSGSGNLVINDKEFWEIMNFMIWPGKGISSAP